MTSTVEPGPESARRKLGIRTQAEFARLLEMDPRDYRRIIAPANATTRRAPPRRVLRLIRAYLDGWRPPDWPG